MIWLWGPVVAAMVAIFLVSGIENLGALPSGLSDKAGHAVAYGGFALVALRALAHARVEAVTWPRAGLAWISAAAYGALDEVHQMFVRGRFAAVDDWLADVVGAAVALAIVTTALSGLDESRKV